MPDEPTMWFERFDRFRGIGPRRTIEEAYRLSASEEGLEGSRPGAYWYTIAAEWRWLERAAAWDDAERERWRQVEGALRHDARMRRLARIEGLQDAVFAALDKAKIKDVSSQKVLRDLAVFRKFFMDLLKAERLEYGETTEIVGSEGGNLNDEVMGLIRQVYGREEEEDDEQGTVVELDRAVAGGDS
jgi:hypothetical protein